MKKSFLTLMMVLLITSCGKSVDDIPLSNIFEHRLKLENLDELEKEEYFKLYESVLLSDSLVSKEPYIYYYLSRLEKDEKYLKEGLKKFPKDPYINFNRKKYLDEDAITSLYKEILGNYPKHNLSLLNLLNNYSEIISSTDTSESFILENSALFQELNEVVSNYIEGENKTTYYDFSNDELYGLTLERQIALRNYIQHVQSKHSKLMRYLPIGEYYQESSSKSDNEEKVVRIKSGGKWEMELYRNGKVVKKDSGRWFFKPGVKENKMKDPKTNNLLLIEFKDKSITWRSSYEYRIFLYKEGCITIPDNAAILEQIDPYSNKNAVFDKSIFRAEPYFTSGDLSYPFIRGSLMFVWNEVCKN